MQNTRESSPYESANTLPANNAGTRPQILSGIQAPEFHPALRRSICRAAFRRVPIIPRSLKAHARFDLRFKRFVRYVIAAIIAPVFLIVNGSFQIFVGLGTFSRAYIPRRSAAHSSRTRPPACKRGGCPPLLRRAAPVLPVMPVTCRPRRRPLQRPDARCPDGCRYASGC